jgi:hypothetical protein
MPIVPCEESTYRGYVPRFGRRPRPNLPPAPPAPARPPSASPPPARTSVVPSAAPTWPEPEPLKTSLPPVEPFCTSWLPDALRNVAEDAAERMQVPIDFTAVAGVIALAGATNRRAFLTPKQYDLEWRIYPNLYGGIAARSGFLKSPTVRMFTAPLMKIQSAWRKQFVDAMEVHERQLENRKTLPVTERANMPEPSKPTRRRVVINDATYEKVHALLADNAAGLFVILDELCGWLAALDRPGREGERQFYLSCHDGDTPAISDRIGRGTVDVPAACLSMFGGIQPKRLRSYLSGDEGVALSDDGLMQRFQLLVWPDVTGEWKLVDRAPNEPAWRRYERIIERVVTLNPDAPVEFRFDADAQKVFFDWYEENQCRVRSGKLSDVLAEHLGKYSKVFGALALLFELADRLAADVGLASRCATTNLPLGAVRPGEHVKITYLNAWRARQWTHYLESHARRIYGLASPEQFSTRELAGKIRARSVCPDGSDTFTVRDVEHKDWRGLTSTERVKAACADLAKLNWLRPVTGTKTDKGGRPSLAYQINPKVFALEADRDGETDQ